MLEVMQAYKDGKTIEYYSLSTWGVVDTPTWNWQHFDYRIAPVQPKKTQKVQLYAYMWNNELRHFAEEFTSLTSTRTVYKRVPSEDKVVEVEE